MTTMADEIINDIAEALSKQYEEIKFIARTPEAKRWSTAQLRDDTVAMAIVVAKYAPKYDIDKFYTRAGYVGTHPVHDKGE